MEGSEMPHFYQDEDGICRWHCNPPPGIRTRPVWPLLSDAAGTHPSQIAEERECLRKQGCPTDYTPDGRVIMTSPAHRKRVLKIMKLHDKSGFD